MSEEKKIVSPTLKERFLASYRQYLYKRTLQKNYFYWITYLSNPSSGAPMLWDGTEFTTHKGDVKVPLSNVLHVRLIGSGK